MRQYEASARTKEEAFELGLQELGVSIGDVDVRVLEEGSKGLFGLFGSRPVKVLLTVKDSEEDPLGGLLDEKSGKKPEKKAEKKPEKKPEEKKSAPRAEEKKPEEKKPEKKAEDRKPEKKPEKKAEKKPAPAEAAAEAEGAEKPEPRTLEKPEVTMIPADKLEADSPAAVAKEFLAELTKLMGVEVSIEMGTDAEGNVYGFMEGDTLGILIGRRGETLDAVQYLTSLKVNRGREGYTRVTLDTETTARSGRIP